MNTYEQQANEFLLKTGTKFSAKCIDYGYYFDGDTQERYIFKITLLKDGKRFSFKFGQSIAAGSEAPTPYDVLSCFQKYDVGTFNNFCSEFGYDTDSRKAFKTYKAVVREWKNIERMYTSEEIEILQEIN